MGVSLRGGARASRSRGVRARGTTALVVVAVAALGAGGCSSDGPDDPPAPTAPSATAPTGRVTVLAAASLSDAFQRIAPELERVTPGLRIELSFGASSTLAEQVVAGAPADVFAAASPATMATVTDAGLAEEEPVVFARNVLQIAVPAGNPAGVTGLADFARDELRLAVCAPEVPCGAAATRVFELSGTAAKPDTLGTDVRDTLRQVQLREVDAALVYATDVRSASGDVEGIVFPEADAAVNDYSIVVLAEAPNPDAATAFVEAVRSAHGAAILTGAGFLPPP